MKEASVLVDTGFFIEIKNTAVGQLSCDSKGANSNITTSNNYVSSTVIKDRAGNSLATQPVEQYREGYTFNGWYK